MGKKLLASIFFLIFLLPLFAQTDFRFTDSTAQWNVLQTQTGFCLCGDMHTHIYKIKGDTVINGLNYQQLNRDSIDDYYIRRDSSSKVYLRYPQSHSDSLLYDFGRNKGDTIKICSGPSMYNAMNLYCCIDSVDTIFLDKPRKREFVRYAAIYSYPHPQFEFADVWIDGVGAISSDVLAPGFDNHIIDGPTNGLLCFFENNTLVYHDTAYQSCVIDTSWNDPDPWEIKDIYSGNSIQLYPNPASYNYINIQLNDNPDKPLSFQLYDITGRMVLQKPLVEKANRVDLNGVSNGIYLYNIISSTAIVGSGKLTIQ